MTGTSSVLQATPSAFPSGASDFIVNIGDSAGPRTITASQNAGIFTIPWMNVKNNSTFKMNNAALTFKIEHLAVSSATIDVTAGQLIIGSGTISTGGVISVKPGAQINLTSGLFDNLDMAGGEIDAPLTVPAKHTLSGYGTMGNLTIQGILSLTIGQILNVDRFATTGNIIVNLQQKTSSTAPFLVSTDTITLGGSLKVIGGKVGNSYTLFRAANGISGNFAPLPTNITVVPGSAQEFRITVNNIVTKSRFLSPSNTFLLSGRSLFSGSLSQSYFSSLQHNMHFTQGLQTTQMQKGLTFTTIEDFSSTFMALNTRQGSHQMGLYGGIDTLSQDFGAYFMHMRPHLQGGYSLHFGNHNAASKISARSGSFMTLKAEVSSPFEVSAFKLSPKMIAGCQTLFSSKGLFHENTEKYVLSSPQASDLITGLGIDVSSKWVISETPVEFFLGAHLLHHQNQELALYDQDQTLFHQTLSPFSHHIKVGLKAFLDETTEIYGVAESNTVEDNFEVGFKIKL